MEDSKIKVGDWVYASWPNRAGFIAEEVFKCSMVDVNGIWDGYGYCKEHNCQRLTPLESANQAKPGDRVAVMADEKCGEIATIGYSNKNMLNLVGDRHRLYFCEELALIPGRREVETETEKETPKRICSEIEQWKKTLEEMAPDIIDIPARAYSEYGYVETPTHGKEITHNTPSEKLNLPLDIETDKPAFPCPHPEWEGVWDVWGVGFDGYRVRWCINECYWIATHTKNGTSSHMYDWVGPHAEGWKLIEPAPTESVNAGKMRRPKKHGEIQTPWDPYQ